MNVPLKPLGAVMGVLYDHVAIVTGGTSGIGRAAVHALAGAGAAVVVAARRRDVGTALVRDLVATGHDAIFLETDVCDPESVTACVEGAVAKYGRLSLLVNCAGVPGGIAGVAEYTEHDWDQVMSVNVKGVWLTMRLAIPHLLRSGAGSIVNVASEVGFVGSTFGISPYVASKHAVVGLTRAAALEYAAKSLRVNAVCPGLTDTEMIATAKRDHATFLSEYIASTIPMRRMAAPHEPAAAILWLCSPASRFMTGHALVVDGGILVR